MRKKRTKAKTCPHKNLTKCEFPHFSGYKLCIQRRGFQFSHYFPAHGDWKEAERKALAMRDAIRERLHGLNDKELTQFFFEFKERKEA